MRLCNYRLMNAIVFLIKMLVECKYIYSNAPPAENECFAKSIYDEVLAKCVFSYRHYSFHFIIIASSSMWHELLINKKVRLWIFISMHFSKTCSKGFSQLYVKIFKIKWLSDIRVSRTILTLCSSIKPSCHQCQ